MPHLDISQVRSRDRVVTQTISRALFEEGAAGIRFRSNLDDGPCAALFEGRARLEPRGEPVSLTEDVEELLQVARGYGLVLRRGPAGPAGREPGGGEARRGGGGAGG